MTGVWGGEEEGNGAFCRRSFSLHLFFLSSFVFFSLPPPSPTSPGCHLLEIARKAGGFTRKALRIANPSCCAVTLPNDMVRIRFVYKWERRGFLAASEHRHPHPPYLIGIRDQEGPLAHTQ